MDKAAKTPVNPKPKDRKERLEEALRKNLKRRKVAQKPPKPSEKEA